MIAGPNEQVPDPELMGPVGALLAFGPIQRGVYPAGDLVDDLVLELEHVVELAVESLRPYTVAGVGLYELGRDPDPVTRPAHAALPSNRRRL